MKKGLIIFLIISILFVIIALVSLLHSIASQTPYIEVFDDIFLNAISKLWELVSHPIILGVIAIYFLLWVGLPGEFKLLSWIKKITASYGSASLSAELNQALLLSDLEEKAPQQIPATLEVSDIGNNLYTQGAKILTRVANKKLKFDELVGMTNDTLIRDSDDQRDEFLAYGIAIGVMRSLDGILLHYSVEDNDDGGVTTLATIDKPILSLLYDNLKNNAVENAPN